MRKKYPVWILGVFLPFVCQAEIIPFTTDVPLEQVAQTDLYALAEKGEPNACYRLAVYLEKQPVKEYPQIVRYLKMSANKGHLEAQFALGHIYQYGKPGVLPNALLSSEYYRKAAMQGDTDALRLAKTVEKTYEYRLDSSADLDEKWDIEWYRTSAGQGDAESQYMLGRLYLEGKKVEKDPKKAVAWFYQAAQKEHLESMVELARLYIKGEGTSLKGKKGVELLEKAAERDFIPAQQELYKYYLSLKEPDYKKAYKWLYVSVAYMFPDEPYLRRVSPTLGEVEDKLSPSDKLEVLRQAEDFILKHRPLKDEKTGKEQNNEYKND